MSSNSPLQFILITGLSGAGKALATSYFEDFGFRCVDNLPPALIPAFADWCAQNNIERAAVVADIRSTPRSSFAPTASAPTASAPNASAPNASAPNASAPNASAPNASAPNLENGESSEHRVFLEELQGAFAALQAQNVRPQILFLETDDERLIQRFKETRRKHPLSDESSDLSNAIATEREALGFLRERADKIVNTSHVTPRELRQIIEKTFVADAGSAQMLIQIESFGFKYGALSDADLVFDVRFLPNPNYDANIGHLSGRDQPVIDFVLREPLTQQFQAHLRSFLEFCVPQFEREGKAYLSIGIGCTGGRHRSVVLTNWLAEHLKSLGFRVGITHRDIERPRASKFAPTNSETQVANVARANIEYSISTNNTVTDNAVADNAVADNAVADFALADATHAENTLSVDALSNAAPAKVLAPEFVADEADISTGVVENRAIDAAIPASNKAKSEAQKLTPNAPQDSL